MRLNKSFISLTFWNFIISPEEITQKLNIRPTKIELKGQEYSKGQFKKNARHTFWMYEWEIESNDFVGDNVDKFIEEIIKPRVEEIKSLANEIVGELKVVQYYYDGHNPGYHFSGDVLKTIAYSNLDLDIDTYCLCE